MKTLLALTALLAAAIVALVFPDMKKILLLVPFALLVAALFSGCATTRIEAELRKLSDGHFEEVTVSQQNLGIGATLTAANLTKKGNDITFDSLNAQANTPWTGTTIVKLKGASLDVSPNTRAKHVAPVRIDPPIPPPPAVSPVGPQ